ncbi:type II toxin-antitoxin system RelE/ParE family toxin [Methylobacterium sp. NEAU 140]|uniref:type II toxin-antitoxin system RelE/ParE family toxin n=1 Tax=Methylobacterium sp. NEAU 140 TaxID=3064945 RepID=UPI0027361205|nr:type II toxin-antitoxin system RelE/ParE family toxin [Methylobacterium sp. NEAU 140]MDP4021587.1 type II toxin-antitoxin system RelE/ParE family toxin [Methylobacterium sp. NEAU 140]
MALPLHTIVETPDYLADAKRAGMTEADRDRAADLYAESPDYGDEIRGSGGVRKGRLAGRGKGKSGGFRIVSIYLGAALPVYLIAVLSKGDRETFTDAEVNQFKTITTAIKAKFRGRSRN